jgi:uncharacterized FAD-dependent dehydrogenase
LSGRCAGGAACSWNACASDTATGLAQIVAQYSLKCRPCTKPPVDMGQGAAGTLDAGSMAIRCKVKVGLQLYKIQEDSYLLDIRKVDGDVLPFMDVCSLLLAELKL